MGARIRRLRVGATSPESPPYIVCIAVSINQHRVALVVLPLLAASARSRHAPVLDLAILVAVAYLYTQPLRCARSPPHPLSCELSTCTCARAPRVSVQGVTRSGI